MKWLLDANIAPNLPGVAVADILQLSRLGNIFHDIGKFTTGLKTSASHPVKGKKLLGEVCLNAPNHVGQITIRINLVDLSLVPDLKAVLDRLLPTGVNPGEWFTKAITVLQLVLEPFI